MSEQERRMPWLEEKLSRRQVIRGGVASGLALSAGGLLAACGGSSATSTSSQPSHGSQPSHAKLKQGGTMRVGAAGGGSKDSIDAHTPTSDPDITRVHALYEPLANRSADFSKLEMVLAESIEPEGGTPNVWVVRLRRGVQFHNGKPLTADDVIFSLMRITDPKDPKVGNASIGYIDRTRLKKVDQYTLRIPLQFANATFPDDIGQYFNAIVPVGYDPAKPVGTGAFKYQSFAPGQQSVFVRNPHYWRTGEPLLDELVIIDFADDTARVNALLGGQVEAISSLPPGQLASVQGNSQLRALISETGTWTPFTMRVDVAPFNDVRVRQAMRLIVDRKQMLEQALSGQGRIANDLYSPYDPCYAKDLPQRQTDVQQAKSLLRQAGHSSLAVQLNTGDIYQGVPEAAQVFAQQAKAAGVQVQILKLSEFYGNNYLKYAFAQDFWATRTYLTQVAQGSLPNSPFNETHWDDPQFNKLIRLARGELDQSKRCQILHAAQMIEYERGGHIIPYFVNTIDAYSAKIGGFEPAKSGFRLGDYRFRANGFVA